MTWVQGFPKGRYLNQPSRWQSDPRAQQLNSPPRSGAAPSRGVREVRLHSRGERGAGDGPNPLLFNGGAENFKSPGHCMEMHLGIMFLSSSDSHFHSRYYLIMVAMFFTVSVVNNYALNLNIAMPLHMIFRSVSTFSRAPCVPASLQTLSPGSRKCIFRLPCSPVAIAVA